MLDEAKKLLAKTSPDSLQYLDEIKALTQSIAGQSGVSINVDLAELRGYHYHTGMVYTAFVPGEGEGIAFGGRYDDIGSAFGRARPATGFSADVKSLLKQQSISKRTPSNIFAPLSSDMALNEKINGLRKSGKIVIEELEGQQASAREMNCDQQLSFVNGEWVVEDIK